MPMKLDEFEKLIGTPAKLGKGGDVTGAILAACSTTEAFSLTELMVKLKTAGKIMTEKQVKNTIYNLATNPKVKKKKLRIKYDANHAPFYVKIAEKV
jgi:hypothetical protein